MLSFFKYLKKNAADSQIKSANLRQKNKIVNSKTIFRQLLSLGTQFFLKCFETGDHPSVRQEPNVHI